MTLMVGSTLPLEEMGVEGMINGVEVTVIGEKDMAKGQVLVWCKFVCFLIYELECTDNDGQLTSYSREFANIKSSKGYISVSWIPLVKIAK